MVIESVDYFMLDEVSSNDVGLWCDTPPIQPLGDENGTSYQIGSDTDMYVSDDSYKDITFKFICYGFNKNAYSALTVYEFLRGKKELRISRQDGFYWKIRSVSCTPSQSYDGHKIKYQISIKCEPWRYIDDETIVNVTQTLTQVQCGGTRFCKPLYALHLSALTGTGTLGVGDQQVSIIIPTSMGSNTLYIDSERQIAYDGNLVIRTQLTAGIYPFMDVGMNIVSFGGIVEGVEIKRNQRCY
jgi:phage-related protein